MHRSHGPPPSGLPDSRMAPGNPVSLPYFCEGALLIGGIPLPHPKQGQMAQMAGRTRAGVCRRTYLLVIYEYAGQGQII